MSKEAVMTYFEVHAPPPPIIYLKRPEKFGSYLNQDSRCPGRDMNKAPPKHKLKVLLLEKKLAEVPSDKQHILTQWFLHNP